MQAGAEGSTLNVSFTNLNWRLLPVVPVTLHNTHSCPRKHTLSFFLHISIKVVLHRMTDSSWHRSFTYSFTTWSSQMLIHHLFVTIFFKDVGLDTAQRSNAPRSAKNQMPSRRFRASLKKTQQPCFHYVHRSRVIRQRKSASFSLSYSFWRPSPLAISFAMHQHDLA